MLFSLLLAKRQCIHRQKTHEKSSMQLRNTAQTNFKCRDFMVSATYKQLGIYNP